MAKALQSLTTPVLIAPCGLNCRVCRAYSRDRNPCPGCRIEDPAKAPSCIHCAIKTCGKRGESKYCFDCDEFPCKLLVRLEKRYTMKYGTSPIGNLNAIRAGGIRRFVRGEDERWRCPSCGGLLCMHRPACESCGYVWNRGTS